MLKRLITTTYTRTISYVKSTPNVKTVTVSCVGRSATAFTCNVSNPNNVSLGYTIISSGKGASATGSGGTWTITYTGGQANYAATFKVCSKDGTLITADSNGNGSTCISKSVTFNPKS